MLNLKYLWLLFRRKSVSEPSNVALGKTDSLPTHVAIIMDGNGRWATQKGLPRIAGHKKGVDTVKTITRASKDIGVKYLTLYTFSTENWRRSDEEVNGLMALVEQVLKLEIDELNREGVKVMIIGRREGLPSSVIDSIERAEKITRSNTTMTLVIALNYGGRAEIVDTVKNIAEKVSAGQLPIDDINEALVSDSLYTTAIPDPDLLIRTGGDLRISNFLLWQLAYTEIWVTQSYWPDFSREEYIEAIMEYQCRERRYGGIEQKSTGRSR